MKLKLKPCPFCGKVPETEFDFIDYEICCGYQISCDNPECDIQPHTDYYDSEQETIEAWNTRKGEDNMDKEKEILEEIGNISMGLSFDNEEMYLRDFDMFKKICKKYGV